MNFTIKKLFGLLTTITLGTAQLAAMTGSETDRAVKQEQQCHITIATPPPPPRIHTILVEPATRPTPQYSCCGKKLRKIAKACDCFIKCQTACCTGCADCQANRMEQKMAVHGNYLPELCCLTCISLSGRYYEDVLTLCNYGIKTLAGCCNGNNLATEITEELQETRKEQELKLAVQEEVIKEIELLLQDIEAEIKMDGLENGGLKGLRRSQHTYKQLQILHLQRRTKYAKLLTTSEKDHEKMRKDYQETLAALEESKKDQ
jgi:hypothetical protein